MSGALEAVLRQVGWQSQERVDVIEPGQVRRFCEAVGDPDPRWTHEAPPTFVVTLLTEPPQLPEAYDYGSGWLNGGDRFEYLEPVRPGDVITSRTVLKDAYEKQGSSGSLLFLVFDTEFTNQQGSVAARIRGTRIRR